MKKKSISSIYKSVCETPGGDGLHIEYLPQLLEEDMLGNSTPHVHLFYEIIWFKEAGGYHTIDLQEYPVKANTLFFLSPGQVHHFDGTTLHKGIVLKFCTDFLKEEKADEDVFIKYNVFNAFDTSPFCEVTEETAEQLQLIIEAMLEEKHRDGAFGHMDMLRSLVKIFLIQLCRHGIKNEHISTNHMKSSHHLYMHFRKLLELKYKKLHVVSDYAQELNVSVKTLANSVSEYSGKSPLAFINDRIILEAKRLLRFTQLAIKEIAYILGYEDPSYFVKFFKRKTGILPTEFRDMHHSKEQTTVHKIAIPTQNGEVDNHFGHCQYYTILHANAQGKILRSEQLASPQGCGCKSDIAEQLARMGVSVMLAGNMGKGAYNKLTTHGIQVIRGCKGKVEEVGRLWLDGKLKDNDEVCSHHDCATHSETGTPPVFHI